MSRRLPLVCPSVGSQAALTTQVCNRKGCGWWGAQESSADGCTAGEALSNDYRRWFVQGRDANLPTCAMAERCTWDVDALARGEAGCAPRRLGSLCEHQGGDWNTFAMADPDDACWEQRT